MDRSISKPKTKIVQDLASLGTNVRLNTQAARVVVTSGPEKGTLFRVPSGVPQFVGTDPTANMVLTDPTVSRRHAVLTLVDGGARVEDLESTNGTFYEGSRIRQIDVPFGATVSLGKTQMKVLPEEEDVAVGPATSDRFGLMLGDDRRMREIFALLADLSPTDTTVLIEGETGTGKELVARAIHDASRRRNKPFVVFDCSAVPANLIESALFGHLRGAFTGAAGPRAGAFRSAQGGTLFLDEIGELPLEMQPKLLRALEGRAVQAVGSDQYEAVDARVVAATNRSLKAEVRSGRFREDLYYRLAVVKVGVPALRERITDIPRLAQLFIEQSTGRQRALDPEGLVALEEYDFPGNVRELKNLVLRALALSGPQEPLHLGRFLAAQQEEEERELSGSHNRPNAEPGPDPAAVALPERANRPITQPQTAGAPAPGAPSAGGVSGPASAHDPLWQLPFKEAKQQVMEGFEGRYLGMLMERCQNNLSRASQSAQVDRKHLRDLLRRYGLWQGSEDA